MGHPILRDAEYRRALGDGTFPGFLLFGDEDYLKLHAVETARQAVSPDSSFDAFNYFRFDALDYTPARLLDALIPLPMMQERKLIVLTGMDLAAMRAADVERFCATVEQLVDYPHNCLIVVVPREGMDVGYLPKRPSSLFARLTELLAPVRYDRVSPARLADWLGRHFAHGGVRIAPAAAAFLIDYCGRDMFTLAAETEKLCCYVKAHGREEVSEDDIRAVACAGLEYDAFAFGNAIMEGRRADALAALAQLRHRRTDPLLLLGEVIRVWSDMLGVRLMMGEGRRADEIAAATGLHPYKVGLYQKTAAAVDESRIRRAIALCAEADAALKLSPQGYMAIERLVCTL